MSPPHPSGEVWRGWCGGVEVGGRPEIGVQLRSWHRFCGAVDRPVRIKRRSRSCRRQASPQKLSTILTRDLELRVQMFIYTCAVTPHGQRSLAGYSPWGHNGSDLYTCAVKPQGQRSLADYSPWNHNESDFIYTCAVNPMDREAWQDTVRGVTMSQIQLSNWACRHALPMYLNSSFKFPYGLEITGSLSTPNHNGKEYKKECVYVYMCVCVCVCIYTYIHTYKMYKYMCIYIRMCICICIYIYIYIYTYIYNRMTLLYSRN